jgi:molybdopterin biosynthesis enzyme
MDDNHNNFMADIIASGTNTIATFTDEECSQVDMYLNIPPNYDDATPVEDTTTNIEDNSRNNEESLVNESTKCSRGIYIYHALTSYNLNS